MSLQLVKSPSLKGAAGIAQLRALQTQMARALGRGDFTRVRQLDLTCATLLDKLIAANSDNRAILVEAMTDLKDIYAQMIRECQDIASAACS